MHSITMQSKAIEDMPTTSKTVVASLPLANIHHMGNGHVTSQSQYPGAQYLPGESYTHRGPLPQVLKILFLSCLPCLIVLIRSSFDLAENVEDIGEASRMRENVLLSLDIVNVVHATQLERGSTVIYISSGREPNTTARMMRSYTETNRSFSKLSRWVSMATNDIGFQSCKHCLEDVQSFRQRLSNPNTSITIYQALEFYSKIIATLIGTMAGNLRRNAASVGWSEYVAYHLLTMSKEEAGIERALGCTYYTQDDFRRLQYHEKLVLGITYMGTSKRYASYITSLLEQPYSESSLADEIDGLRRDILYGRGQDGSVSACESWFDTMSRYIEILRGVQHRVGTDIYEKTGAELETTKQRLTLHISIIIISVCLIATVSMEMYLLNRKAFSYACHLFDKSIAIEDQRIKSQQLLLKALPQGVATELLLGNGVAPQRHMSVSVMFTEIVEFSELVSHVKCEDLVDFICSVVAAFDERLELYDVNKMEMMGGTTMIASGFESRGYADVFEIADAAKDLMTTLSEIGAPLRDADQFGMTLRIGINTGPVVTGLVGNKLPRYSVFGDTVNTASRMMSTALPGMIQLTNATRKYLETNDSYRLILRGKVAVKGKGEMTTYTLSICEDDILSAGDDYRSLQSRRASRTQRARSIAVTDGAAPSMFLGDPSSTIQHLSDTINCRLPFV